MIVAPEVFAESSRELSYVHTQPATKEQTRRALMALVSCPTSSIGTVNKVPGGKEAARSFPEPVGGGIYYCGYASEDSYGASSWLITRPEGNVLVDSPRAAAPLLDGLKALGGVKTLFLTHQDDVADHAKLRDAFGCERLIHEADDHIGAERRLSGRDPIRLADDLVVIPVPGHTRGSAVLHWKNVLFTGDHLWGDADGHLAASRGVAWHSWREQTASMERLLDLEFDRVLPGHGRPWTGASPAAAREELARLVAHMKRRG
jgi:glyoxylase-like metal-dependent hydrolase (beta-lactamase superfamily II)